MKLVKVTRHSHEELHEMWKRVSFLSVLRTITRSLGTIKFTFVTKESALTGNSLPNDCRLFTALKQNSGHKSQDDHCMETVVIRWLVTMETE
jgi:hypothetical protein